MANLKDLRTIEKELQESITAECRC